MYGRGYASFFETALTRLNKNRMQWWAESLNLFPPSQYGFRSGRSCSDNLASLSLTVEHSLFLGHDVLACFLDVKGAFDNVKGDLLIDKLKSLDFSNNIIQFVWFLLQERSVTYQINPQCSYNRKVSKGLPQGGVLSPLLYLIYVSHIASNLDNRLKISQFADDIAVFLPVSTPLASKKILESSINSIKSKLHHLGLSLSPSKCVLMHFNRKNILPGTCSIVVDGHKILSKEYVKFLGIIFEYRLNFAAHIDTVRKKCLKRLNILKFVSGIRWGAEPNTLLILYKNLIRSIIEYNSFIFLPKKNQNAIIIERIQYAAIRTALSYRVSTPTNILLDEAKCSSIYQRSILLGCKFLARCYSNSSSSFTTLLKTLRSEVGWDTFLQKSATILPKCIELVTPYTHIIKTNNKVCPYLFPYEALSLPIAFNSTFGLLLKNSNSPNEDFLAFQQSLPSNSTSFFTDGSKIHSSDHVGAAYFAPELNISLKIGLDKHMSSFTAECIAIKLALESAIDNKCEEVYIFSDCLSALQAMSNSTFASGTNIYILECKFLAFKIRSLGHNLNLIWIPAHRGIAYNAISDALAKPSPDLKKEDFNTYPVPVSDLVTTFKRYSIQNNLKELIEQSKYKGKHFFKFFRSNGQQPWFVHKNLSRDLISFINRSRSNHYHLAFSLHRVKITNDPSCTCGSSEQDLNHCIWQCPILDEGRDEMIASLCAKKLFPPYSIENFLYKPYVTPLKIIFKFLKSHQIFP
ncbi:uncharacterized protein [Prorops nasuta]|uniref:uncharacterized protein n=1 Tax=Prorops nasuta TaxID=863751 RepID=UPI0034CD78F7